jgi:transposase InsO family protein
MDQRVRLIGDWLSGKYTKTDLAESYGVSRPTVYKWLERYETSGIEGLAERSSAPHQPWNRTASWIEERLVEAKIKRPRWGPKKLIARLKATEPWIGWPAVSTAGEILKREGLVKPRRRRRRVAPYTEPFKACDGPNRVWSADFKGQFKTQDNRWCYPLTISDNYSRCLLACRGLLRPTFMETRGWFEWVFREYGLPEAIRTDNGVPFASVALGGLAALSIWWIKLGIRPERIQAGHPEENGRHERMHRTLKDETARPPKANRRAQQAAFNRFMKEYNEQRPHEGLGMKTPVSYYHVSGRAFPNKLEEVVYDKDFQVRRVRHNGEIRWQSRLIYLSETLAKEPVGLKNTDDGKWEVYFSLYKLGEFNERENRFVPPTAKDPVLDNIER